MRYLALVVMFVSVVSASPEADSLASQGEQLARDGEYTRAIEAFKKAEALAPSAKHACLIGLAYMRRELWSQAEIFLDRCKSRATASDPLPDWFGTATATLADKLKGVDTAPLTIRVDPPGTPAKISISSFAPDETFEPRTIHVVPGNYVVTATAPDQPSVNENVVVKLGADNVVTIHLRPPVASPPPSPPPARPVPHASSSLSRTLWIGAASAAVVGVGLHVFAYHERGVMQDAVDHDNLAAYTDAQGTFEAARAATIACYALAIVGAGVGYALRDRDAPTVTATITHGGAMIGFEVHR